MPQDWHRSIQGVKHHSRALDSSQQQKLKISNVLLWKPVSLNQENKESRDNSYGKELKAFLVVSQASCCGFCPFLWHDWRGACCLTCMGPIPITHHQTHTSISVVRLGRYGPIPGLVVEKAQGEDCRGSQCHSSIPARVWAVVRGRQRKASCRLDKLSWHHCFSLAGHVTHRKVHHIIISIKSMVYAVTQRNVLFLYTSPHPEWLTACSKVHRLSFWWWLFSF